ncbi:hypothetical protein [Staphylococcus phage vB_ScaM-V1SC04]|nr:hypothetical protein [Staphylococcus phage vB_ScaM-V1SC04]
MCFRLSTLFLIFFIFSVCLCSLHLLYYYIFRAFASPKFKFLQ